MLWEFRTPRSDIGWPRPTVATRVRLGYWSRVMEREDDHVSATLNRHAMRRARGIPTISVLSSEGAVLDGAWMHWAEHLGRTVVCRASSHQALMRAWEETPHFLNRVISSFERRAADVIETSTAEFHARCGSLSPSQREDFADRLSHEVGCGKAFAVACLAGEAALRAWLRDTASPADLRELDRVDCVPPTLLKRMGPSTAWLSEALATAARLARELPSAHLAVSTRHESFLEWRATAPASLAAFVGEGLIRFDVPDGATDKGLARSAAERALFGKLETRPRTHGLFALNQKLKAQFGGQAIEVDLLCEIRRVAIEVDGYHHFGDPQAYRRDREKDLLLQQLGYTVVRVLWTDIERDQDYVLSMIDGALGNQTARGER